MLLNDTREAVDVGGALGVGGVGEGVVAGVVGVALEFDGEFSVVLVGEGVHGAGQLLVDGLKVEDKLSLLAIVAGGEVDVG